MTPAQLTTLKNAINADQALASQPMNSDGAFAIAAALNLNDPDFIVWRPGTPISEIMQNGFDWTIVDNLSVGKARIWDWMKDAGSLNFDQSNVRAGVNACFAGAGASFQAIRVAIFGHGSRKATRFEKIFATGTGTSATEAGTGPGTLVLVGPVSYPDVEAARAS